VPKEQFDIGLKSCDHTSVGMLVWKENKLLMIERKRFPFGYAPPAGHVDSDPSFEVAAIRELDEEVGLNAIDLQLIAEGNMNNHCRRINGTWHYWRIYEVHVKERDNIQASFVEVKKVKWFTKAEIRALANRTKLFLAQQLNDEEWQKSPGLEVVWYEWFQKLSLI
jgi:ADP-ribose pyrophosphatase YjhB (NUDIX family)